MSLQEIYTANFGGKAGQEAEKTADDKKVEEGLAKFSEEDCTKLAAVAGVFDSFKMEFESGEAKLAAACKLVDHLSEDDGESAGDPEKTASDEDQAKELDAAGRLMARSFMDELESVEKTASAPKGSFAARLNS